MKPNEETIYQASKLQDGYENEEMGEEMANDADSMNAVSKSEKKSNGWAKVTISGVTGILMGAGGMYAGKPYVDEMTDEWRESLADMLEEHDIDVPYWPRPHNSGDAEIAQGGGDDSENGGDEGNDIQEPTITAGTGDMTGIGQPEPQAIPTSYVPDGLHVASVDQNLSFDHAFAQARAEVGPGGVFYWHGGVYNTYTEAEWNNMTAADHQEFAHQVAPAVYHHVDHVDYSEDMAHQDNLRIIQDDAETPDVVVVSQDNSPAVDSDVHILGVDQHVNEDGSVTNAGFGTIDGEPLVVIDVDGDGVFDGAFHDTNANGVMEENEVLDISDAGMTTDSWAAEAIAQGNSEDGTFTPGQPDVNPQDELASNMPDYTNDSDVSDIYST